MKQNDEWIIVGHLELMYFGQNIYNKNKYHKMKQNKRKVCG